ncbi:SET and MYND domain-containing protein 4-like isoform X2 [Belonocnema kinseyi]|uniref:SET and MYND domain-containing protein 4-like isoform X2 n=1 Tax=Belonocnema kinseyi TaxID=2817044 RepID=UPI00143D9F37|nr:SET and MYND domain-containing protein 4-like isoform X2 [Belonocnema kinseyi]
MESVKELILNFKKRKSHVGYGFQKESEALVSHVLDNFLKTPLPDLEPERKNEEDSIRYREEGNQHFVAGDDSAAIECYTKSLAFADSKELMATAHANRSAALFRKQLYKQCLIEIDAALSLDYPEEKKEKLKERGRKALKKISNSYGSTETENSKTEKFDPFETKSNDKVNSKFPLIQNVPNLEETKEAAVLNNIPKENPISLTDLNGSSSPGTSNNPRYLKTEGKLSLTYGPSEESSSASSGLSICISEKYGRHIIATRSFEPGDILSLEDPYSYTIYRDKKYTHCHHCLLRSHNMIPCPHCPIAQYCSEQCKNLDWKLAHCTECPISSLLSNLLHFDVDKTRMLSKIVRFLIVATKNGTDIEGLRQDIKDAESNRDSRTAGFTENGILDSKSARAALSLATNMSTRPPIGLSAFACISALAATLLATQTTFFGVKYEASQLKNISELSNIKFCASLMFRACVITSSNCFSIQQRPGVKSGSGLYIFHSLFNHSCTPNTLRHFEGLKMITRAMEWISPGDQVFTSYGGGYQHMPRSERKKKMMEDYFFDCDCTACIFDWPTYPEIIRNHVGSISKNKELVGKLKPFKKRLLEDKYDVDAAKSILKILYKEAKMPCEEIVHGVQYLKSYYLDP